MNDDDRQELERLRAAMAKLNRLRSNVVATQNASWSNQMYPFVAILNEAGYELEGATGEQMSEHLACYGGAGRTPTLLDHTPPPESLTKDLAERRIWDDHPMTGSVQIHAERWRQRDVEGFDDERDDQYICAELINAALCYADAAGGGDWKADLEATLNVSVWPWPESWWKPSDDPIRNLVKAGALLAAEIDRVQRTRS